MSSTGSTGSLPVYGKRYRWHVGGISSGFSNCFTRSSGTMRVEGTGPGPSITKANELMEDDFRKKPASPGKHLVELEGECADGEPENPEKETELNFGCRKTGSCLPAEGS